MVMFTPKDISTEGSLKESPQQEDLKKASSILERSKNKTSQFLIKKLPSQYLSYPKNSRILVDTYSYGEIKKLSDSKLPIDIQYEILLEGIHTEPFDKYDLTFFDFVHISVLRKLSSMKSPSFTVSSLCPKCKKFSEFKFGLEELSFAELEVPELPIKVDFASIGEVKFMPLTIGNFISLIKDDLYYQKDKEKYILDEKGEKLRDSIALMAAQCSNLPFKEVYHNIYGLNDSDDINLLEQVDGLLDHGIEPLQVVCKQRIGPVPKEIAENIEKRNSLDTKSSKIGPTPLDERPICMQKININLIGGEVIIRPFCLSKQPTQSRISFGN